MKEYNKIILAGELLVGAAEAYRSAKTDIDYAKSILMSGAVIGIVHPWLIENGIDPSHTQLAKISARIRGIDIASLTKQEQQNELRRSISFHKLTYNSLKHAGNKRKNINAADDLILEANLKEEADYLIGNAIDDYNKLPFSQNMECHQDLLKLLQSNWAG